mgnify:CR=1 FL=1
MTLTASLMHSTWSPDRPTSRGATAYHDAVVHASWHKENINELIEIVKEKIKPNDIVIDFGAGTGASTVYLLQSLKPTYSVILMDNSASWLGKAYETLHNHKNVAFYMLGKKGNGFMTPNDVLGKNAVDHVISANTVHLIPHIEDTFRGIYAVLKRGGSFSFQSGNILRKDKENGVLMIDDTVKEIHDIALEIIRTHKTFGRYAQDLDARIVAQADQRKVVFPDPRLVEYYVKMLKSVDFKNITVTYKKIKVKYDDWMNFVRVRRLQAGILPEVGGKDATPQEERDRDDLITKAANILFKKLKTQNPLANGQSFIAEWVYVQAKK